MFDPPIWRPLFNFLRNELFPLLTSFGAQISFSFYSDEMYWTAGNPTEAISSTLPYNTAQFTTVNGAVAHRTLNLMAGTWTFKFNFLIRNDCGYVNIDLGAQNIATNLQLYSVTTDTSFTTTYTVNVTASGVYDLVITTAGKHPSSTSYDVLLNKAWGYRTGA